MTAAQQTGRRLAAISAHQGGSEQARPGTYEAYQRSLMSGAQYVEFDIRRTRDQVLVVQHDGRAGRARRRISDLTYPELCEITGYPVPRVDKVMQLLAGRVSGHLDLKEAGYEDEVIELAMTTFGPGNFVVTTAEDASVAAIKRSHPGVRAALSLRRGLRDVVRSQRPGGPSSELLPLARIRASGADWVALNYKLAEPGVIDRCQRSGIGVMVWTVDSDDLIGEFIADPRVDVLITNRPRYAVRRRASLGG
jgi:glycerophosphoryl diester phosphodiesterase